MAGRSGKIIARISLRQMRMFEVEIIMNFNLSDKSAEDFFYTRTLFDI